MRGESDNTFDNDHMFFDKLSHRAALRDRPKNLCYFFSHSDMRMVLVTRLEALSRRDCPHP
jgi:hypothetical protein